MRPNCQIDITAKPRAIAKLYALIALLMAGFLLPTNAHGTTVTGIPVLNSSFETPDVGNGTGAFGGWEHLAGTGIFAEGHAATGLMNGAFDGRQHATFHQVGYIYQVLSATWLPNAQYTVRVAAAHRSGFGHGTVEFGLWDSENIGTDLASPGYIDVQELFQGSGNSNTILNTFVEPDDPRLNVGVLDRGALFTYQAPAVPPSGNLVAFARFFTGGGRATFDNFRVTVVPEPESTMLAAFGVLGFLIVENKRTTNRHRETPTERDQSLEQ